MSKKIKLSLDSLQVESFSTNGAAAPRGTVEGHMSYDATCGETWCGEFSCAGTCGETEYGDCGVVSADGGGISICCPSMDCTGNAGDLQCYNSYNYCLETQLCPTRSLATCFC